MIITAASLFFGVHLGCTLNLQLRYDRREHVFRDHDALLALLQRIQPTKIDQIEVVVGHIEIRIHFELDQILRYLVVALLGQIELLVLEPVRTQTVQVDGHLHALLPLGLPDVHDQPVVVLVQLLRIAHLHRRDQILPEQFGWLFVGGEVVDSGPIQRRQIAELIWTVWSERVKLIMTKLNPPAQEKSSLFTYPYLKSNLN